MGAVEWLQLHWLDFLQSLGIVGGLLFTAISLRTDSKIQRVANLLSFTKQHREIWTRVHEKPELSRVLETRLNLEKEPITKDEELFVTFVVLHLSVFQEAMKQGLLISPEGLQRDVKNFFSLPIPLAVWEKMKPLQDQDFIKFVESAMRSDSGPGERWL